MPRINFVPPPHVTFPIDVALSYAKMGIAVFPCREVAAEAIDPSTGEIDLRKEKTPLTIYGLKDATRTERIINRWWSDNPRAVVGVPTGENLGAWVLDLDRHDERDGFKWLADMEALHGPLPPTARATTANGGQHIFFAHVDGVRNRAAIADGVDTRGTGGYIIAPGSVMADGREYRWLDHDGAGLPDIAAAPQWLLDMVINKPAPAATTPYTYAGSGDNEPYVTAAVRAEMDKLASTSVGSRGSQLNLSAFCLGTLVGSGALSRGEAEAELYSAAQACGIVGKDGERSARGTIKRGLDAGTKQPRHIPERSTNDNTPPVDISGMLSKKARQAEPPPEPQDPATSQEPAPPTKKARFELTWFDDIVEGAPKETFVKGVFGNREFTTVSGLPGTGKSVIVTDGACHVATGMDWHGRKVTQGLVIYVAAERKKLTERRMRAFKIKHKADHVPLLVVGGRLDFTRDLKDAGEVINIVRQAELDTGQTCVWIILDTLSRVFGAGDQNASKDMSRFVQSVDEILLKTSAHVTAIHHTAWSGERGKGAIDLDGAVDASFMVKKNGTRYQLVCDGTNDGEEGTIFDFEMESIKIGEDEEGEPTTAPVVVAAAPAAGAGLVQAATHKARALALLVEMLADGEVPPLGAGYPQSKVVPEAAWRQAFYDSYGEDATQATRQATFSRAKKHLLKERRIGELGQWTWPLN